MRRKLVKKEINRKSAGDFYNESWSYEDYCFFLIKGNFSLYISNNFGHEEDSKAVAIWGNRKMFDFYDDTGLSPLVFKQLPSDYCDKIMD